jgi:predicted transcriptional regulator
MRNENFYVVQGWMMSELGLSGNELTCYAIIFGATQGGQTTFRESRNYLAEWMNVTLPTVDKSLSSLVAKGYIAKKSEVINGVKFNSYRATYFDFIPPKETLQGGSKESLGQMNIDDNILKNEIDKSISKSSNDLFEKCWIAYRRKGKKGKAKPYWDKLTDIEKENVLTHIKAYVGSRELQYQQDFERYLRDKTCLSVVVSKNNIVYDPTKLGQGESIASTYMPSGNFSISWDEKLKAYLFIGFYNEDRGIADGYTDDNRPDGARIVLNNGRGTITWNASSKKWERE